jgi:hypothetical protein
MSRLSYSPFPFVVLQDSEREIFVQFDGTYFPNLEMPSELLVHVICEYPLEGASRAMKLLDLAKQSVGVRNAESFERKFGKRKYSLFWGHSLTDGEVIEYPINDYDIVQRTAIPFKELVEDCDQWLHIRLLPDIGFLKKNGNDKLEYHGFIKRRNL